MNKCENPNDKDERCFSKIFPTSFISSVLELLMFVCKSLPLLVHVSMRVVMNEEMQQNKA